MQFVMLCGLVLAVAATPYLKKQAVTNVNQDHVIEKRSKEQVVYGYHQNAIRVKKGDPFLPSNVRDINVNEQNEGKVQEKNTATSPEIQHATSRPIDQHKTETPSKSLTTTGKFPSYEEKISPVVEDESAEVSQQISNLKPPSVAIPYENLAPKVIENQLRTGISKADEAQPKGHLLQVPTYDKEQYFPLDFKDYYYQRLRQAFRRTRRAVMRKRRSAKTKRRSKRELGYDGEYDPYRYNDEDDDDNEDKGGIDEEALEAFLAPYIKEALLKRYGDILLKNPELMYDGDEDDGLYNRDNSYLGDDTNLQTNETPAEIEELLDAYATAAGYPENNEEDEYERSESKRTPLLSMVPGNRRKRFEYPYSLDPQGRWGGIVPKDKRESYDEVYNNLYRLAEALARRKSYKNYLEALESYKK